MRRITAGNDVPFRWAVTLQGKPFDLTGKDVKVYVINSRGEIPVAQLTIEGHEVSGVFEGRYQTRLGEHSLVLHVNEGRPEMKTAAVANVFELVQWSADAGGSDEGDVIVAPVLIESELSIGMGGGSSYDDTEVKNELARLEREKADKSELTELSAEVSGLSEGIALRNVGAEDTDESVDEPDLPTPSASNEWKCVYDGRMEVGKSVLEFSTYADNTPMKAEEIVVQVLIEEASDVDTDGYISINSTTNKTKSLYGTIYFEKKTLNEANQLQQLTMKASPMYMVANMYRGLRPVAAVGEALQGRFGNEGPQIYEDITYVRIKTNSAIAVKAPLVKIYAR